MEDMYGRTINQWDVVLVVDCNEQMHMVLVTSQPNVIKSTISGNTYYFFDVVYFDENSVGGNDVYSAGDNVFLLSKESVPEELWQSRNDYIDSLHDEE